MKKLIGMAALCVALVGCATVDVSRLPDPRPLPSSWRQDIAATMKAELKDPYSVRDASITQPYKTSWAGKSTWGVCVEYNAKNSFGAYTGKDAAFFFLVDGNWQQDPFNVGTRDWAKRNGLNPGLCKKPTNSFVELEQPLEAGALK